MAADIREGSRLYIGPSYRKATVEEITSQFDDTPQKGLILEARVLWEDGGSATVKFKKSSVTKDLVTLTVTENVVKWGLRGHSRNTHAPPKITQETSSEYLAPFL